MFLVIGDTKENLVSKLGARYEEVEASSGSEVIAYKQWVSVQGPDYVGKTLYIRFVNSKVSQWKITNDTTSIVPRAW